MAESKKEKKQVPIVRLITPDYKTYVNSNKWYSYDYCSMFIIYGGRGVGKTTSLAFHVVDNFVNKGEEFVYVRRYKTELKKAQGMLNPLYSGITIQGIGQGGFQWTNNGVRLGYGLALTAEQTFKSGVDFSKVTTLIFDEFTILRGGTYRYLDEEVKHFLELISTVFRTRTNYKIFLLGNNLDAFNPYSEYFNIPVFDEKYIDKERGLYCEFLKHNPNLLKKEQETPLYKLTKGTEYGDYHYENKVLVTKTGTIGVKDPNAKLLCRLVVNRVTLNIYRQNVDTMFVEFRDKVIKDDWSYIILENTKPNYLYVGMYRTSNVCKFIDICYFNDMVLYSCDRAISVFETFMEAV